MPKIDPKTGERIDESGAQIDPQTGERIEAPKTVEPPPATFVSRLLEDSPLGLAKGLLTHPLDTLASVPGGIMKELGRSGSQLKEAWNTPNNQPMKAIDRTLYSIPFVGGGLKNMDEDAAKGNYKAAAGGMLGTIGSLVGGELLREKIPTRAGAGELFDEAMGKAANEPVNLTNSLPELDRIKQLADNGGTMPTAAGKLRDLVQSGQPLDYRNARDFASNLSGLSAGERGNLTPAMNRQAGTLSKAFNSDVGDAATRAGAGKEYNAAMKQYAQAMALRKAAITAGKLGLTGAVGYGVLHQGLKPLIPER